MRRYCVCVVGVGAVGIEMLKILKERNFPVSELCVFAQRQRDIEVGGTTYNVKRISPDGFEGVDIALFAGTEGEKGAAVTYAHEAIKRGAVVIDNGSDFRLKKDVPLVVPEINAKEIKRHKGIIANPNCSTIQMVLAIWPVYKTVGIKRIIVCTYQAASGVGRSAIEQLRKETFDLLDSWPVIRLSRKTKESIDYKPALPQQIAFNIFPHIGGFEDLNYTSEEWKMVKETHKILGDDKIKITATCVRVAVRTGHSEAIYIETKRQIPLEKLKNLLSKQKGLKVLDSPKDNLYPLPVDCEGRDEVFVGRVRKDPFVKNGFWLWCVADNLRKGAALNAVQIAERLIRC